MDVSLVYMQKYFEERMAKFESDLQKKSSANTSSLADEFASFKMFVKESLKAFLQQLVSKLTQVFAQILGLLNICLI